MLRLAHLSDLHFGRVPPRIADRLLEAVSRLEPDLTVITGDMTQRSRSSQWRMARDFVDRLPGPVICVPGNHDAPLENVARRLLSPWRRYRRYIALDVAPTTRMKGVRVVGANSASRVEWQRGRLDPGDMARACKALADPPREDLTVLAMHHPLEQLPDDPKAPLRDAADHARRLAEAGAEVVLCGHMHTWRAMPILDGRMLQIQAGTSLSLRTRGEENDFNLLTLSRGRVEIERHAVGEGGEDFLRLSGMAFAKRGGRWVEIEGKRPLGAAAASAEA
ncbi:MAG: metallophosphoesterase family protein [Albimonas sp.]|uniref:metallophosphoesterase family protein n=1 Tax=Albimonas sp. TaxID=1872425 RepID=UPI00405735A9